MTDEQQHLYDDALAMTYTRARGKLTPEYHSRLTMAWELLIDGKLMHHEDGAYSVAGSGKQTYAVGPKTCECVDFTSKKAPGGSCKHILALSLHRRAIRDLKSQLSEPDDIPDAPAPKALVPVVAPKRTPSADLTVRLHGKTFVTFAGLLALAHSQGLQGLDAQFIYVDADLATATATATFADGRCFTECGDATPGNVGKNISPHFARMALTRAKARCLRDALNIGMAAVEELADLGAELVEEKTVARREPFVPEGTEHLYAG